MPAPLHGKHCVTDLEAQGWLERVGARVLHHPEKEGSSRAWATLICTPAASGRRSKIILTFGRSLVAATQAAEARWHEVWDELSDTH